MPISIQTTNKNSIRQSLISSLNSLKYKTTRDHKLMILSCYIDFDAIKRLISAVSDVSRITKVELMFEYFEAYRGRRPNEISENLGNLTEWLRGKCIEFEWSALRVGALMHAKAYAVIQEIRGEQGDGIICIGSGNATLPGLGSNLRPNVELSYITNEKMDIVNFVEIWNQLKQKRRSLEKSIRQADEYEFAYSLMASGVFLHEWKENFRSHVGINYTLTAEGKKRITIDDELRTLGFDVDQATINRDPLSNINFSFIRDLPKSFSKKYTIDSLIGRWCPHSVWTVVEKTLDRDENYEKFKSSFIASTASEFLEKASYQESIISNRLVDRGLVKDVPWRIERWKNKIETLRNNEGRLKRIFLKFDDFAMPYEFSSRENVLDLYESFMESLAIKTNRSFISKKIEEVSETGDLSLLDLNGQEITDLENLLDIVM